MNKALNSYIHDKSINKDLHYIFDANKDDFKKIKNKNIFLTGCTGFFGYWIMNSFVFANQKLNLKSHATFLTRDKSIKKKKLFKKFSNINCISFVYGDIRNFKFPLKKKYDYIIHGATTSALETFKNQKYSEKRNIIIDGTKRIFEFAKKTNCKKILYLSSGAVYNRKNFSKPFKETDKTLINLKNKIDQNDHTVLGLSKGYAENFLLKNKKNFKIVICRFFTFVGPFMPLSVHYAVGNFLKSSINNKKISLISTGESVRSFMYIADCIKIIWSILLRNTKKQVYNVGSDKDITIAKVAKKINFLFGLKKYDIKINKKNIVKDYYIPNIARIKKELKIKKIISLDKALKKTLEHIKSNQSYYKIN